MDNDRNNNGRRDHLLIHLVIIAVTFDPFEQIATLVQPGATFIPSRDPRC